MTGRRLLILAAPLTLLLAGADWPDVKLDDVKYHVSMPDKPKMTDKDGVKTYLVEAGGERYVVYIREAPFLDKADPKDIEEALNAGQKGAIEAVKGTLEGPENKNISLEGSKSVGREMTVKMTMPPGYLRARVYVVGNKMVQLIVVGGDSAGGKEFVTSGDAKKFLESLKPQ